MKPGGNRVTVSRKLTRRAVAFCMHAAGGLPGYGCFSDTYHQMEQTHMGILSATVSISRYRVEGTLESDFFERVEAGLRQNAIEDIDNEPADMAVGWTSRETPFEPLFEGDTYKVGDCLVFALRIDKKAIPAKVVQKRFAMECARRLADSGREQLSKAEKKALREAVIHQLCLKIPATPHVHELIWHTQAGWLWFFSTQKAANEELETLFTKSFKLSLVRAFPYTLAVKRFEKESALLDKLLQTPPTRLV